MSLPPVTEKQLQDQIITLLKLYGWRFFHPYDSRRSVPGLPDILAIRPPRVIFAELKVQHGRVTPAQQTWLEALGACPGVETYTWRPSDLATIAQVLARTA